MAIIAEVTNVQRGYRGPQKLHRFDNQGDALKWAREQYRGYTRRERVFVDTKSRGTIQSGWIFHVRGEGQYWVTFAEIVSETNREVRSIDLGGRP